MIPYVFSEDGIIYDNDKDFILLPLCRNDTKDYRHEPYTDILVEVEVKE
jgi:hypothetical protein